MVPPPAFEWTISEYSIWLAEIHFGDNLVNRALVRTLMNFESQFDNYGFNICFLEGLAVDAS